MGAIAELIRYELFQVEQTANLRSLILWVDEKYFTASTSLSTGTTLTNFMSSLDIPKADAVEKYGSWVYSGQASRQNGCLRFWFTASRSAGEISTAFLTLTEVRAGVYWPPVLTAANIRNFYAYDADGTSYVADVSWDFQIRDSYAGPTRTVIEYFASHAPHTISTPTSPQPEGGTFYYGVAQVTIPKCLHPWMLLTYSTGNESARFPSQSFSKVFPATNLIGWPSTMVLDDGEVFDNGIYIRRKVTAYRPTEYASTPLISSPSKASISTTTVTLGGYIDNDGGTAVLARGIVVSATATNPDPVIGGTGVTTVTHASNGTGTFTVSVTGLTTATAYTYKAYATNARGTVYTTLDTFTTS